jgi:hypothetical protein
MCKEILGVSKQLLSARPYYEQHRIEPLLQVTVLLGVKATPFAIHSIEVDINARRKYNSTQLHYCDMPTEVISHHRALPPSDQRHSRKGCNRSYSSSSLRSQPKMLRGRVRRGKSNIARCRRVKVPLRGYYRPQSESLKAARYQSHSIPGGGIYGAASAPCLESSNRAFVASSLSISVLMYLHPGRHL